MRNLMLVKLIIFFLTFSQLSVAYAAPPTEWAPRDWSIVVSSCDKYSILWDPFFKALEHSWPDLNSTNKGLEIYLIANAKQYDSKRVKTINIPNEQSWSDTMLSALEKIDSKYILFFLEDYWITRLDHQRLMKLMERFEKEDAAYMELFDGGAEFYSKAQKLNGIEGVVYKGNFQNYRANLQLALWEKKALQQILRSGEDIWAFELAASIRSSGYPKPFFKLVSNPPIVYLNATHRGHITVSALEFAQQQDINFTNNMPVLGKYNWRLIWKEAKFKVTNFGAFIKRNILGTETNSYRYLFED